MWEHMTEQQYQHEVIVPDKGFPFKLFLFEGHSGKYIREKHWHRSIEIFAVQEGELDFILDTTHYHLGEGEFIIVNSNEVHAIHANRPNHTIVLQIPLNQFASYFTGEQFIWFSHSERTYDEQVACLIFRMYKVYRMQTDGYDFEIAVTCLENADSLYQTDLQGPVAVVVGSEAEGVSDGLLEAAVKKVFIPMEGQAESLNAAVAAGIVMFECLRQRLAGKGKL